MLLLDFEQKDKDKIQKNFDEIFSQKENTIKGLKEELISIKEAHHKMINSYTSIMTQHFIPIEELGFDLTIPDMIIQ